MLKKTMTYIDFDGEERTEDFYFNLSNAEIAEMEMSSNNGLKDMMDKLVAAKDNKRIIEIFKDLILQAYGEKSVDGKRFIKSKELSEAFSQTEAYSDLFISLLDAKNAAEFIKAVGPQTPKDHLKSEKTKKNIDPPAL